ncbi:MAG: multicopper oxidase domain-containing protein [Hyphomicrobiaceae bacterium]
MYLPKNASKLRQREAQNARNNRAEIVKALSLGEITRRDLLKWGLFTTGGLLLAKNGFSPYARSAFGADSTGAPRTPLYGAQKFTEEFLRVSHVKPTPLTSRDVTVNGRVEKYADFPAHMNEPSAKRLSYHTDFTALKEQGTPIMSNGYRNPRTNRGPMEGRPPGEMFAHQRWEEFFPKQGYVTSLAPCAGDTYFHHNFPDQAANAVWCFGEGQNGLGSMPPKLYKLRYGEPVINRVYNNLPVDRAENGGFGRNESQLHFHNAHNGAESDGAANVHHFPGTFFDYRWSTTLARRDKINIDATDRKASGPDDANGIVNVPGDWREIQGSMWAHDHRFFFTAENVYKGNLAMVNMYSGRDRGREDFNDGVNLNLPSGTQLPWGNCDFDINVIFSDAACDAQGQYFFDIFTTDGFIGDLPLINFTYAPVMQVLPRKYRFRTINATMARFIKLAIATSSGTPVKFQFIANDGNLVINPLTLTELDEQSSAERYDIVVDFSQFRVGESVYLVNRLQQTDGRKPDKVVSMAEALSGLNVDPCVGALMKITIVDAVPSVDRPGHINTIANSCGTRDRSRVPLFLTDPIKIVAPVRTRVVEFGRGSGDSRDKNTGECIPDCSEVVQEFPWIIKINGQSSHSMNANRIGLTIPKPGEVEHWTYVNGGGGWDHPIHLHFEEGVTMNRGNKSIPNTEKNVRKDTWRLRPSGQVQFQVQFGEYGGSYVNHCHNTVHEDFAMLFRVQVYGDPNNPNVISKLTMTPNPSPDGVTFTTPEIQPEGDPTTTPPANATSTSTVTGTSG